MSDIPNGARLALAAFGEFGPRVATKTSLYERAKRHVRLPARDQKDFDDQLLRLAREYRGIINPKVQR